MLDQSAPPGTFTVDVRVAGSFPFALPVSPSQGAAMSAAPQLRLFAPPEVDAPPAGHQESGHQESGKEHRTTCPGVGALPERQAATGGAVLPTPAAPPPAGVDPELWEHIQAAQDAYQEPHLAADDAQAARDCLTVRGYYEAHMQAERQARVAAAELSAGTLAKDRQALNRWERLTRPDDWEAGRDWRGFPIGHVTTPYVDEFLKRLKAGTALATAKATWSHLRTIFGHACSLGVLTSAPKPKPLGTADSEPKIWEPDEIDRLYRGLAGDPNLQAAFVTSLNAGPRSVDLFCLRWEAIDLAGRRPLLRFTSRKTGKRQAVPLALVTLAHLWQLPSRREQLLPGAPLFPGLTSFRCQDPEKSRAARARTDRFKSVMRSVGIPAGDADYERPWQIGRATCNTRLQDHQQGAGDFVLGHGLTLNARHYWRPTRLIIDAIDTVPQPPAFLTIFERLPPATRAELEAHSRD